MNTLDYLLKRFGVGVSKRGESPLTGVNRTEMAKVLGELGFREGVEVGVAQGWHAEVLCQQNPGVLLHAVDIWDRYDGYNEYQDRIDKYYEAAKTLLEPYGVDMIKKFSTDAAKDFEDGSLDFVYIDGAHDFKNVAIDLCEWYPKVRIGGIMFGHDYKRSRGRYVVDVKDVVQAFAYAHGIFPWFSLANDIRDPRFGRDNPGWLFIRQEKDLI